MAATSHHSSYHYVVDEPLLRTIVAEIQAAITGAEVRLFGSRAHVNRKARFRSRSLGHGARRLAGPPWPWRISPSLRKTAGVSISSRPQKRPQSLAAAQLARAASLHPRSPVAVPDTARSRCCHLTLHPSQSVHPVCRVAGIRWLGCDAITSPPSPTAPMSAIAGRPASIETSLCAECSRRSPLAGTASCSPSPPAPVKHPSPFQIIWKLFRAR